MNIMKVFQSYLHNKYTQSEWWEANKGGTQYGGEADKGGIACFVIKFVHSTINEIKY